MKMCWWPAAILIALTPIAAGCGGKDGERAPLVIDERAGTYGGVGIGDTANDVRRVFGNRDFARAREPFAPLEADFVEVGGPVILRSPCFPAGERTPPPMRLRYDNVTFALCAGSVYAFMVTAGDAETISGIGIGDDQANVRGTYGGFECGIARPQGTRKTYPYCEGNAVAEVSVWFGGDPVASITVAKTSLDPNPRAG